jgi:hypothetical protein
MLLGSTTTPAASAGNKAHNVPTNRTELRNTELAFYAVPTTLRVAHAFTVHLTPTPAPPAPVVVPVAPVAAPVVPTTPPSPSDATSVATSDWQCIRVHESGDRYNDPSEPSGAYGILISTWRSFGFTGWPYQAAPAVQDALALRLYAMYGFHPWSSRFACGL